MARKPLLKCFISYCHEGADFPTINAFHAEIERLTRGSFTILRDKSNIEIGGRISDHEKEIHTTDAILLLLTPEYKRRIVNRSPSGVYREYGIILSRYKSYVNNI